jgi:PAS domain S-box-containing protein
MKEEDPERKRKDVLNGKSPKDPSRDVGSLRHELSVHQEELKAQNEELRRAQLELSRARDRYKELFDSAPIGYLVLDGGRKVREANLTAASLLGTPRKSLIGNHIARFMDREAADAYYLHLTEVMDRGTQQSREMVFRRPDGSIFYGHLETSPDEDSLLGKGWRIALVEITARKQAEEALRKAKDELEERTYELYEESLYARSLIEASMDPLLTISIDGKIMDVNHASEEVTGVLREQLIGSDFSEYFTEPEKARAGYEEVFRQGLVRDYPLELKHRDGHVTPVLYNAIVYRDETGRIMGVFAAARDITERKQAEAALRRLASELVMAEERERKRIAGVLHDDIAQILATVRMRLDMLQGIPSEQKDKTLQEAKSLLMQCLQETRALMNDLGNPLLFDMGLKPACEALAGRLMERHPIRIDCDIRDAYRHLDPNMKTILYQVIRELLNNVVKHSKAQNAHVMIDMENGHFRMTVTDDGLGFDTKMLGAPTVEGGFGLYSIRERLIAIGGSLRIESAPGTGTVVTAILPAAVD